MKNPTKSKGLKILMGLGNPGVPYLHHRHNVGYWLLDELIKRYSLSKKERPGYMVYPWQHEHGTTYLLRSKSYMNDSGIALGLAKSFYKVDLDAICVAYDDMDFSPGALRIKKAGGSGGHNGIKSIHSHMGKDFWRMRLGVGRPSDPEAVKSYVLSRPGPEELIAIQRAVGLAVDHIELLLEGRYDVFTEKLHTLTKTE